MEKHDEEFQKYLKEFHPRRPRALPQGSRSLRGWRLAAAALVAAAVGSSVWWMTEKRSHQVEHATQGPMPPGDLAARPLEMRALTKVALDDPNELEARLEKASRRELPDFRAKDSTLRVLAKE